ncbi:MAG: phosphoribosylaminoimidazolesuccinocarboxamide synthase [Dehalococcoidia bacterium]|nr:phosphoribosylaminoimidazolesuccinocarboxamide synthase [Dehalococcoidia bacterium]
MTTVQETNLPGLLHRGKVRDTYDLGDGLLLMVATDRVSAFDVVLPTPIPSKGVALAALSAFWFRRTVQIIPNHLLYYPADEGLGTVSGAEWILGKSGLSEAAKDFLVKLPKPIAKRAMVVRRAQRVNVECVVRGYLAGSAWAEYQRSGTVQGIALPKGLREGDQFPQPLFTPTTKAEQGHDLPMTNQQLVQMVGRPLADELERKTVAVYQETQVYARTRGIIIADTKMEFGLVNGQLILIDELLTSDSSRFWDAGGWAPGKGQPNFDKQFVRDWLLQSGWDREPPAPALPKDVVEKTRRRYLEAYRLLTGQALHEG